MTKQPPDDTDRLIEKVALERAEENAKRVGLDRRSFLATSAGLATTLSAVHLVTGCGSSGGGAGGSGGGMGGAGGTPFEDLECDLDGARQALDPSEMFLMDVQTHHVDADNEYDELWQETNVAYAVFFNQFFSGSCPGSPDPHIPCLGRDFFKVWAKTPNFPA